MVVVTTFLTPSWLGRIAGEPPSGDIDDDASGVGQLVSDGAPRVPRSTVARRKLS
jgi:hypothetical protein